MYIHSIVWANYHELEHYGRNLWICLRENILPCIYYWFQHFPWSINHISHRSLNHGWNECRLNMAGYKIRLRLNRDYLLVPICCCKIKIKNKMLDFNELIFHVFSVLYFLQQISILCFNFWSPFSISICIGTFLLLLSCERTIHWLFSYI